MFPAIYKSINDGNKILNSSRMAYPISKPKILSIPTYDGSGQAIHPSPVFIPRELGGYKYWMAFTPYPYSDSAYENPSIVASNDGENWVIPTGLTNPIFPAPATGFYADPILVYKWDTNELMLFWSQYGVTPSKGWMSKSTNGVTWSAPVETSDQFDGMGISYINTNYFVAQGKQDNAGFGHSLTRGRGNWRTYTSTDGITWKRQPDTFDNLPGSHFHPSMTRLEDGYHYISCVNNSEASNRNNLLSLYYGYSPDMNSILYDSTPLLSIDATEMPTESWYYSKLMPLKENICRVYFSGKNIDEAWVIGYFDIVLNNPYKFYQDSPFWNIRQRTLFHEHNLRDTTVLYYKAPAVGADLHIGIPELTTHREKTLICINTLKDAAGVAVPVTLWMKGRFANIDYTFTIAKPGTTSLEQVEIASNQYVAQVFTNAELPSLGRRMPPMTGISIQAKAVPTQGTFSLYLITQ